MIIAVDIDGVLAEGEETGNYPEDYKNKTPVKDALIALRVLKRDGHYVYLYTARFEEDREVTKKWLEKHGFRGLYKELIMDKPKYDLLIDDRALRFKGDWTKTLTDVDKIRLGYRK